MDDFFQQAHTHPIQPKGTQLAQFLWLWIILSGRHPHFPKTGLALPHGWEEFFPQTRQFTQALCLAVGQNAGRQSWKLCFHQVLGLGDIFQVIQQQPGATLIGGLAPTVSILLWLAVFRQEQGAKDVWKIVVRFLLVGANVAPHIRIPQQKLAFHLVSDTYLDLVPDLTLGPCSPVLHGYPTFGVYPGGTRLHLTACLEAFAAMPVYCLALAFLQFRDV